MRHVEWGRVVIVTQGEHGVRSYTLMLLSAAPGILRVCSSMRLKVGTERGKRASVRMHSLSMVTSPLCLNISAMVTAREMAAGQDRAGQGKARQGGEVFFRRWHA